MTFFPSTSAKRTSRAILHIHGLGYIDRPYSCCQSLEYLKLFGLKLPHAINSAKPAKHAEVLLAHMVRFSAILQGHFTGTISWDALNISFAPYLGDKTDKEVRQFAQMLVYEFSQLSATRGGQALYTDIHLYYDMPPYWADLPAIGPAGKPTGKTYRDYAHEAQRFARAIFEVFKKGDATGKPFILPRPLLHITDAFWEAPGADDLLRQACDVAGCQGNTCFVFDRKDDNLSPLSCGKTGQNRLFGKEELGKPWLLRQAAIQSVTLNLPRLGYKADGDEDKLFELLKERMNMAAKAHIQKKDFLEKLLSYAEQGPLAVLAMNPDGCPFLRMNRAYYIIGLVGLNELVLIQQGSELHQSPEALKFGLKLVEFLRDEAERLSEELGMKFVLEQSPAETTAYRFARLDLKYYSPVAGRFVQGDIAEGAIYYTNSTHFNIGAPVPPLAKVIQEGQFHRYLAGEVITHLSSGRHPSGCGKVKPFCTPSFFQSASLQIDFSPEFTSCLACGGFKRPRSRKYSPLARDPLSFILAPCLFDTARLRNLRHHVVAAFHDRLGLAWKRQSHGLARLRRLEVRKAWNAFLGRMAEGTGKPCLMVCMTLANCALSVAISALSRAFSRRKPSTSTVNLW